LKKILTATILFSFILTSQIFAQRKDFSIWENISLEKRIAPKLMLNFKHQGRISNNATQLKYYYFDIGLTYKINKSFQTAFGYRFIHNSTTENITSKRHRIYWMLCYKIKLKPFILSYRHILQSQVQDIYSSENGKLPNYFTRSKVAIKYDLNKFTPYLATELKSGIIRWNQLVPNKVRLFVGCNYKFNKLNEIELYYLLQKQISVNNPQTTYILGIGITHTFY